MIPERLCVPYLRTLKKLGSSTCGCWLGFWGPLSLKHRTLLVKLVDEPIGVYLIYSQFVVFLSLASVVNRVHITLHVKLI